ncbi:CobW family GTP-binding protein [Halomonas sp. TD01]|uniref:CobW family GTP-binding protein n=1 Tax=Halomonas sp. TD01 TaxID=999141 RepID=UPI000214EBE6|nr:GTP-binding protein [Halomonas sp. TD01]EGP21630.1 cobalamin synthesis protein/P47K family protein [Halomonas sp. TD01]CAH1043540.1 Metal chaperone, involved in Zn homeostasis [Halomonas sp. TD01]
MQFSTLTPVNVLTGFLGSGKTTLLNRWVRQASMRNTLIVINEFGDIGLDHQLITQSDEQAVVEMSSGCLCCTLRGDLSRTLQQAIDALLAEGKPAPARVVIETTGLADPAPILQLLMTDHWLAHRFQLDSVVCCVDAANGESTLQAHRESQRQVAIADRLLITKTDLVDEVRLTPLANQLASINPAAEQWQVVNGNLSPELLVGAGLLRRDSQRYQVDQWLKSARYSVLYATDVEHEKSQQSVNSAAFMQPTSQPTLTRHGENINAFCFCVEALITPEALENWLDLLMLLMGEKMLRIKAIVHLTDREEPLALHGVQHIFHPPTPLPMHCVSDRISRFVFITQNVAPATVGELYSFFTPSVAPTISSTISPTNEAI